MIDIVIHPTRETSAVKTNTGVRVVIVSKRYIAVFLLVTILLSVWIGLCAA